MGVRLLCRRTFPYFLLGRNSPGNPCYIYQCFTHSNRSIIVQPKGSILPVARTHSHTPSRAEGAPTRTVRAGSRPRAHAASARPSASASTRTGRHAADRSARILEFDRLAHAERGRQDAPEQGAAETEQRHARLHKLQRQMRHRKADRAFSSQMPAAAADEAADAPRPGVYKGEMGRSQRKSAHMQAKASPGSVPGRIAGAFPFSFGILRRSRAARMSALVCACLILACAFVYPAAKDCYTALRTQDQAAAEYQAILDRNAQIKDRVALLSTDEGMEDLARSEYGYVKSGDNAVKVAGISSGSIAAEAENDPANIASGSVPAPTTWYSPVLDVLFGYQNGTTASDSSSGTS